jgi:hypothetical protein
VNGIHIGRSVLGNLGADSGEIFSGSGVGMVSIGGDIAGGTGTGSGQVGTNGQITGLNLGGSLLGGVGDRSGRIIATGMGMILIQGNLHGDSGASSGGIFSLGKIAGVRVGGSLTGGVGSASGSIVSGGQMGMVKIGGDLQGGSISGTDSSVIDSGWISGNSIVGVVIGGSVFAGTDDSSAGSLVNNAAIDAAHDIGSIVVKHKVLGSIGSGGDITPVTFAAQGAANPTATKDVAIGTLTIAGSFELKVFAGFSVDSNGGLTPQDGNAQIGNVTVQGDWRASTLIAGVQDTGAAGFGDVGDTIIGGVANSIAKIANIVVNGDVVGDAIINQLFPIESHAIGKLKIHGHLVAVPPAPGVIGLSPQTATDVIVRTIS